MTAASSPKYPVGAIISADLTLPNADSIRDFYQQVIGWEVENLPMQDQGESYSDYVMKDTEGNWVGGVCHARGMNAGLPPQWLIYVHVADVAASVQQCEALGGKALKKVQGEDGALHYAIIQDPAGAVLALTHAG